MEVFRNIFAAMMEKAEKKIIKWGCEDDEGKNCFGWYEG